MSIISGEGEDLWREQEKEPATFGGDTHLQWCKDRANAYLDRGASDTSTCAGTGQRWQVGHDGGAI